MEAEEKLKVTEQEEISWVAWSLSTDTEVPWNCAITKRKVDESGYTVPITSSSNGIPSFFADMQTVHGGDTANLRYKDLSATAATVFIEEETSNDGEVDHTTEVVGYLSLFKYEPTDPLGYIGLGSLLVN